MVSATVGRGAVLGAVALSLLAVPARAAAGERDTSAGSGAAGARHRGPGRGAESRRWPRARRGRWPGSTTGAGPTWSPGASPTAPPDAPSAPTTGSGSAASPRPSRPSSCSARRRAPARARRTGQPLPAGTAAGRPDHGPPCARPSQRAVRLHERHVRQQRLRLRGGADEGLHLPAAGRPLPEEAAHQRAGRRLRVLQHQLRRRRTAHREAHRAVGADRGTGTASSSR